MSRRTTPSASSARPAGPPDPICITSSASRGRRATRCRSRCLRPLRSRPRSLPPSRRTPRRSSSASSFWRIATSRCWNRKEKGPYGPFFSGKRFLDRERRAATAGALRVGILDDELRAFQAFLVVDLGAGEVLVAHRVDQQGDAVLLHHRVVVVPDLVEGKPVLEAGTAAAGDEHSKLELRVTFLVDQLLDLVGCAVAEQQRDRHLGYCVHTFAPG